MRNRNTRKNPNGNTLGEKRVATVVATVSLVIVLTLLIGVLVPSGLLETLASGGGNAESQAGTEGVETDLLETEMESVTLEEETASAVASENADETQDATAEADSKDASCYDLTDIIEVPDVEFPYYIKVNRQANCVTVYTLDEDGEYTVPIKAMVCSVGLNDATPLGVYTTSDKYDWHALYGNVYGQYAYRICGSIMFHSVPYYTTNKDDLETEEYNKLGEAASLGCIRLCCADAKWLVDNCPTGTTVEIYDDEDPGPLGKPAAIQIDTDSPYAGWDPTDPDPANPWNAGEESDTTETVSEETVSEDAVSESQAASESESESEAVSESQTSSESSSESESSKGGSSSETESSSQKESEQESEAVSESQNSSETQESSESQNSSESQGSQESEAESESETQTDTPQISAKSDSIVITIEEEGNLRACLLENLEYEDREEYWVLIQYSELKAAVESRKFGIYTCTAYIRDIENDTVSNTVTFTVQYVPNSAYIR